MGKVKIIIGTSLCMMLAVVMLSTQAYAAENSYSENESEIVSDSMVFVNPIYQDIISEDELAEMLGADQEEETEQNLGLFYSAPTRTFNSLDEIGDYLKSCEKERDSSEIVLNINVPETFASTSEAISYLGQAVSIAEEHTGSGTEGDYLTYNRLGYQCSCSGIFVNENYRLTSARYKFGFFTTDDQEAEVTSKLNSVYSSLSLNGKTNIAKIKAIYGYITGNVSYDYNNVNNNAYLLKHSTYAAIINGKSVCQGYASLLYRMALDNGVDCRVITGSDHAWNIIHVGAVYYNLDSTWDSNYGNDSSGWGYFLKNMASFDDGEHDRDSQFTTTEFTSRYPMSETDYSETSEEVSVTSVNLDKSTAILEKGSTVTLTATITPGNATNHDVIWSSSDINVATVTNGVVKGIAKGTATITVTTVDGNKKAYCTVTVQETEKENEEENEEEESVFMFRLYNPNSGEHFYTGSIEERDNLASVGWKYEGSGWIAPISEGDPVYRLYNRNAGDHHYTMSLQEKNQLVAAGWEYEGIAWNSVSADSGKPLYRLYNPNATTGTHHYTMSLEERKNLVNVGWIYEGIGWFGL